MIFFFCSVTLPLILLSFLIHIDLGSLHCQNIRFIFIYGDIKTSLAKLISSSRAKCKEKIRKKYEEEEKDRSTKRFQKKEVMRILLAPIRLLSHEHMLNWENWSMTKLIDLWVVLNFLPYYVTSRTNMLTKKIQN